MSIAMFFSLHQECPQRDVHFDLNIIFRFSFPQKNSHRSGQRLMMISAISASDSGAHAISSFFADLDGAVHRI